MRIWLLHLLLLPFFRLRNWSVHSRRHAQAKEWYNDLHKISNLPFICLDSLSFILSQRILNFMAGYYLLMNKNITWYAWINEVIALSSIMHELSFFCLINRDKNSKLSFFWVFSFFWKFSSSSSSSSSAILALFNPDNFVVSSMYVLMIVSTNSSIVAKLYIFKLTLSVYILVHVLLSMEA